MKHFILFILCVLSVELLIRSNYFVLISSTIKVCKRAVQIILNDNISDHWKENIIPKYSFQLIKNSMKMLLILFLITSLFLLAEQYLSDFLSYLLTLIGIIESILFAYIYFYFRKLILN